MAGPQVVGIELDIRDNASQTAPRIIEQFQKIGQAGEQAGQTIQDAFDMGDMSSQFDVIANKIDKLYALKFGKQRELELKHTELENALMAQKLERGERPQRNVTGTGVTSTVSRAVGGVGGGLASIGQGGGAIGGSAEVLGSLGDVVGKAGPIGAAIAGVVGLVSVVGLVIDKLSQTYEPFTDKLMEATAAFGGLSKNIYTNGDTFKKLLDDAGKSAMKFGYSLEQGTETITSLAHGGMGRGAALSRSSQLFAYARGYGVNPANLVDTQILAQRYGQGNVLGLAAGGTSLSGMGAGRYEEYLNAMKGIFEEAISKGVTRGFEDISQTMNFFSKLGPNWQGALGAQRIGQMGQSVAGATELQNETDVFLYRAAKNVVQSGANQTELQKKAPGYFKTMMEMEKGMTVPLFMDVFKQIKAATGGVDTDMIELLKRTFNVNNTEAVGLWKAGQGEMSQGDMKKLVSTLAPPSAESPEMQLKRAEEELRLQVVHLGETLLETKLDLVEALHELVTALGDLTGASVEDQVRNAPTNRLKRASKTSVKEMFKKPDVSSGKIALSEMYEYIKANKDAEYMDLGILGEDKGSYRNRTQKAKVLYDTLTGLSQGQLESLVNSGKMGDIAGKGLLAPLRNPMASADDMKDLIKAIKENTEAVKQPATVTIQNSGRAPRTLY
jgi:hypothetical protein